MQGFECLGTNRNPPRRPDDSRSGQHTDTLAISNLVGGVNSGAVEAHIEDPGNTTSMEVVRNGGA